MSSESKYKVKVLDCVPNCSENEMLKHNKCYLGISLNSPVFWHYSFKFLLKWLSDNFQKTKIIVVDYLNRYNALIFDTQNTEEAIKLSLEQGDKYLHFLKTNLNNFDQNKFEILRWKPLYDEEEFQNIYKEIKLLYSDNQLFKKSVDESASYFIDRQIKRGTELKTTSQNAVKLSTNYILEEITVCGYMIVQSYELQIYPGTLLQTLREIANKKFIGLPACFNTGIYTELKLSKVVK